MHNVAFLQDLAVVMLVAGVVTVVFHWLKQPVVLGYILAGAVIGPHLLPRSLVTSPESVQTLAALGLVFLLFTLGLEFNLRKLQALSMLLSELAIREHSSQQQKIALRTLLSNTILFAGAVAMSVLVLALSAPLLPPWEILLLLCGLAALLAILLRAYFVRLYARAQTVIRETLARAPPPTDPPVPPLTFRTTLTLCSTCWITTRHCCAALSSTQRSLTVYVT